MISNVRLRDLLPVKIMKAFFPNLATWPAFPNLLDLVILPISMQAIKLRIVKFSTPLPQFVFLLSQNVRLTKFIFNTYD